jgi:hypothetical protein
MASLGKALKGRFSVFRVTSGKKPFIRIEVTDSMSGTQAFAADMTMEDFALAVTGRADLPAVYTRNGPHVGRVHEHKTVLIRDPNFKEHDADAVKQLLAEHTVNGWQGYEPDLTNMHKAVMRDGKRYQKVTFHRYVDPVTEYDLAP